MRRPIARTGGPHRIARIAPPAGAARARFERADRRVHDGARYAVHPTSWPRSRRRGARASEALRPPPRARHCWVRRRATVRRSTALRGSRRAGAGALRDNCVRLYARG